MARDGSIAIIELPKGDCFLKRRIYFEELIYKWQEAKVRPSESHPDTAVNRLIAEREKIEEPPLSVSRANAQKGSLYDPGCPC
jgi:hypothetical protein